MERMSEVRGEGGVGGGCEVMEVRGLVWVERMGRGRRRGGI